LDPISAEITYGLERLALFLQGIDNVFDITWTDGITYGITYGDVHHREEVEFSIYNFEEADVDMLLKSFDMYEAESMRLTEKGLALPAYDYCLKCSHTFNLLDARGAISVAERTRFIARVRNLARNIAEKYIKQREQMGFPLLKKASTEKS
jgi:glycyl-tRNA synthetase alpha chain